MRKMIFTALLCAANFALTAQPLHDWLVPLREAIYEQRLSADEIRPLYLQMQRAARERLEGISLDLALSRIEYFMGRALLFEERNQEARGHFLEGLSLAQAITETTPCDQSWVLRAENLSYLCQIGPWTFTVANGPNVERFARNALSFNSRNAPAQYLIAARWVFAPSPFNNIRRGIQMMTDIFQNADMEKDDMFNVNAAIGYAHLQQRRGSSEARPWLERALAIYPTNRFAQDLLNSIR
jgi:hypothetical protein